MAREISNMPVIERIALPAETLTVVGGVSSLLILLLIAGLIVTWYRLGWLFCCVAVAANPTAPGVLTLNLSHVGTEPPPLPQITGWHYTVATFGLTGTTLLIVILLHCRKNWKLRLQVYNRSSNRLYLRAVADSGTAYVWLQNITIKDELSINIPHPDAVHLYYNGFGWSYEIDLRDGTLLLDGNEEVTIESKSRLPIWHLPTIERMRAARSFNFVVGRKHLRPVRQR